jgi:hypothetical protein
VQDKQASVVDRDRATIVDCLYDVDASKGGFDVGQLGQLPAGPSRPAAPTLMLLLLKIMRKKQKGPKVEKTRRRPNFSFAETFSTRPRTVDRSVRKVPRRPTILIGCESMSRWA